MKSAEAWLIWVESTEAVKWTKQLRSAEGLIVGIQRDALEEAAKVLEDDRNYSDAINYRPNTYQLADRIRALKPTMPQKEPS